MDADELDEAAGFASEEDDEEAVADLDVEAGELLDEEPRLSFR
ncbi:hypothetical protein GCM10010272_68270 [Streptomyces lateritius]|nr:hypothetical protein GCM10010272_68270 [Streptomyces lateritius]